MPPRLDLERSLSTEKITPPMFSPRAFLISLGERFLSLVSLIGAVALLGIKSLRSAVTHRLALGELLHQLAFMGNRSFGIVGLIAIFTGMVFALQLAVGFGRFGLKIYIGQVVGVAILRELGPVLTCVMVAARVGSGIAAEIGSMVVTEQVLAIEAMGASPIQKLVVPRIFACVVAAPLLTVMANAIGVIGGGIIAVMEAGVTSRYYYRQFQDTVILEDFTSGIFKALFFGFSIALIACFHGLNASGGTEGVGKATTRAVVHSSVMVFVLDFFLTKLFLVV